MGLTGCCSESEMMALLKLAAGSGTCLPWPDMNVSSESCAGLRPNFASLAMRHHATIGRPVLTVSTQPS